MCVWGGERTVVAFGVVVDVEGFFSNKVGDVLVLGLFLGVPLGGGHCDSCLQYGILMCAWRGGGGGGVEQRWRRGGGEKVR